VGRVDEAAVGRPAVAFDDPGVVLAEHRRGVLPAAAVGDPVDGDLRTDERPQPRPDPTDSPAGFIGRDHRTGAHALGQGLVGRPACPADAGDPLDDPTRGDAQPQLAEQPGDLAGRHPQPLAEPRGQRHRPGTDLGAGRPQRIRGLAGLAGLDPAAARAAAADLDLVAGHQRPGRRQVLDVLDRDPLRRHLAAAAGAARRQPDRDHLIDPLGRSPVGTATVGRTRLAARTLGIGHWVALGERGGLALGRPAQRLHLATQPFVDLPQPLPLGPQPLVLPTQPPDRKDQPPAVRTARDMPR
jgi:hypothetical protein